MTQLHTATHRLTTRLALVLGTHHMMEEVAHIASYLDSPLKAAAVALAALVTHHASHSR